MKYPAPIADLDFWEGAGPHSTPLIVGNTLFATTACTSTIPTPRGRLGRPKRDDSRRQGLQPRRRDLPPTRNPAGGGVPIKFRVYGALCRYPAGSPCAHWKPWDLEAQFAAFCRAAGIDFLSLTEPMRRAAAAGHLLYAPEDSHWSPEGQRLVAEQLGEVRDRLKFEFSDS